MGGGSVGCLFVWVEAEWGVGIHLFLPLHHDPKPIRHTPTPSPFSTTPPLPLHRKQTKHHIHTLSPSPQYTEARQREALAFTSKRDDFFPYADGPVSVLMLLLLP